MSQVILYDLGINLELTTWCVHHLFKKSKIATNSETMHCKIIAAIMKFSVLPNDSRESITKTFVFLYIRKYRWLCWINQIAIVLLTHLAWLLFVTFGTTGFANPCLKRASSTKLLLSVCFRAPSLMLSYSWIWRGSCFFLGACPINPGYCLSHTFTLTLISFKIFCLWLLVNCIFCRFFIVNGDVMFNRLSNKELLLRLQCYIHQRKH